MWNISPALSTKVWCHYWFEAKPNGWGVTNCQQVQKVVSDTLEIFFFFLLDFSLDFIWYSYGELHFLVLRSGYPARDRKTLLGCSENSQSPSYRLPDHLHPPCSNGLGAWLWPWVRRAALVLVAAWSSRATRAELWYADFCCTRKKPQCLLSFSAGHYLSVNLMGRFD